MNIIFYSSLCFWQIVKKQKHKLQMETITWEKRKKVMWQG